MNNNDTLTDYRIARIFQEADGLFYYCDATLGFDARGRGYPSLRAAIAAIREGNAQRCGPLSCQPVPFTHYSRNGRVSKL